MPVSVPLPWRSVWLPRLAALIALIAGLPLYLQSPLWCDITLYDLAAQNLLHGGIHYRDLFDTNLPGFVWILTALRWLFGPSPIVVRVADLAVVIGVMLLIDRLAKWGGATPATRWWALAGAAFIYPFTTEMAHAQRDVWMALPALAAVVLRVQRAIAGENHGLGFSTAAPSALGKIFRESAIEGAIWGVAVWLKPHIVIIAAAVWILTYRRLAMRYSQAGRASAMDLVGNLAGGLAIGGCGLAWLIESGTWPDFWNVLTIWNPRYAELSREEFSFLSSPELFWFPPWSLWLLPSIPLALLSIVDARPWSLQRDEPGQLGPVGLKLPSWLWDRKADANARYTRGVLAGLYLVWTAQAFFIQRRFVYVHVPETLLMLGLWSAHRWAMPMISLLWISLTSGLWLCADASSEFRAKLLTVASEKFASADCREERFFVRHPMTNFERMSNWPKCWRCDLDAREQYALWDRLKLIQDHEAAIGWEELAEVADFLRTRHVKDREVIAWHDSPHAVYLLLGIKPGFRFMHTSTAQAIGYQQVQADLAAAAGTARFAVGDLELAVFAITPPDAKRKAVASPHCPFDLLPPNLNEECRQAFPFNQPVIFRSRGGLGRYTVHELTPPLGDNFHP